MIDSNSFQMNGFRSDSLLCLSFFNKKFILESCLIKHRTWVLVGIIFSMISTRWTIAIMKMGPECGSKSEIGPIQLYPKLEKPVPFHFNRVSVYYTFFLINVLCWLYVTISYHNESSVRDISATMRPYCGNGLGMLPSSTPQLKRWRTVDPAAYLGNQQLGS